MSVTYSITTNFGAKDALPSGDSDKVIKGSQFTTEFTAIQTAFGLCAPAASPAFTGTISYNGTDVTATAAELNVLDGFTGTVADLNYAAALNATGVTSAEFDTLDGITATTTELNYNDITTLGTVEANKTVTAGATAINFNNFDMTNVDINSGNIDGTVVGGSVPANGTFDTLSATTYSGLPSATDSVAGVIELATVAETNTGTATNRAVTPDSLNDWTGGSGAITKLGTIATGVWQGTAIDVAYLDKAGVNTNAVFTGSIEEDTYALSQSTSSLTLDPANGTIQYMTLSENVTSVTDSLANGESITLHVLDGTSAFSIAWPGGWVWIGGSTPTLDADNQNVFQIWRINK